MSALRVELEVALGSLNGLEWVLPDHFGSGVMHVDVLLGECGEEGRISWGSH